MLRPTKAGEEKPALVDEMSEGETGQHERAGNEKDDALS